MTWQFKTAGMVLISLVSLVILFVTLEAQQRPPGTSQTPIYDVAYLGVRRRAIIVAPNVLEPNNLEALGHEFLASSGSNLAELLVGSNEESLATSIRTTAPRGESQPNFADTLRQIDASGGMPLKSPIARVILVEKSALLSLREPGSGAKDQPGVREKILAGGRDPTLFVVQDGRYRLLTFDLLEQRFNAGLSLDLFFKSDVRPSCTACQELAKRFAKITSASDLNLEVRTDTWFASLHFPLVFRFEPDTNPGFYADALDRATPPKIDQYYRQYHMHCHLLRSRADDFQCDGFGRYDHLP